MINLGLSRISRLIITLPTRQSWKAIHIAGTNGKGSVAAYLSSLYSHRAKPTDGKTLNIGRFTSPHLIDRWDCITINDKPVSESLFLSVEEQVKSLASKVENELLATSIPATEARITDFELLTATAFEIFNQQQCQLAIIECGLGGRLDATNVLSSDTVACSVITKIGLDHVALLGKTIEAIAREKAGIAKENVPLVIDTSNNSSVKDAIRDEATQRKAAAILESADQPPEHFSSPLFPHQQQNLSLALLAYEQARQHLSTLQCDALDKTGSNIPRKLLSDVQKSYPGRLQRLSISSLIPNYTNEILLDGAHNKDSAKILRDYVDHYYQHPTQVVWILAMSRGKDVVEILSTVVRPGDVVITCPFGSIDGMPWVKCVDPVELADAARKNTTSVETCMHVVDALKLATEDPEVSSGSRPIVVAGSLYLVSDLLRELRNHA